MARKSSRKKTEFALLNRLDELMARLAELAPKALGDFDEEAIHQARVATRRLAAAAKLLQPVLSKKLYKPWTTGLRKLRRQLGPLRDADVLIGHLKALRDDKKHGAAAEWLDRTLGKHRAELHESAKSETPAKKELRRLEDWPTLRAEVAEAHEAVDILLAESLHLQVDAFAEQADRIAEPDHSADPHELRIAGKALRYTLEMAELEGHSPGAVVLKHFRKMQELLGDWHDQVVLADQAMQRLIDEQLSHTQPVLAESVIELAKLAIHRSGQEMNAFVRLWKQHGGLIAQRIRAAFPLTQPAAPPDESRLLELAAGTQSETAILVIDSAPLPVATDAVTPPQTDRDRPGSEAPAGPGADD